MPSAAYAEWELYKRDAELLEALGATHGALGSLLPRGSAAEEAEQAARRAAVIALAAAYERYIVRLFCEVAAALGGRCSQVGRELAWTPPRSAQQVRIALRNPKPSEVRELFERAAPGVDVWAGITTVQLSTPDRVLGFVGLHMHDRHRLAHGVSRIPVGAPQIRDRIECFCAIVQALDANACRLVRVATGTCPW